MAQPTVPFKDVTKLPEKGFYTPPRQRPHTKTGRQTSPEEYSPAYVMESPTHVEVEELKVRQNLDEKLIGLKKKQLGKRSRDEFERGGRKTKKRSKKIQRRKTRKQK